MEDTKQYVVTTEYTDENGNTVTPGTELDLTEEQAEKLKDLVELKDVASPDADAPADEPKDEAGPDAEPETPVGEGEQGVDPTPEVPAEPEAEKKSL